MLKQLSIITISALVLVACGGGGDENPVNKPDPIKPDPIKPDPIKPDPIKPDPIKPDPIKPDPIKPDPIKPDPIKPDPNLEVVIDGNIYKKGDEYKGKKIEILTMIGANGATLVMKDDDDETNTPIYNKVQYEVINGEAKELDLFQKLGEPTTKEDDGIVIGHLYPTYLRYINTKQAFLNVKNQYANQLYGFVNIKEDGQEKVVFTTATESGEIIESNIKTPADLVFDYTPEPKFKGTKCMITSNKTMVEYTCLVVSDFKGIKFAQYYNTQKTAEINQSANKEKRICEPGNSEFYKEYCSEQIPADIRQEIIDNRAFLDTSFEQGFVKDIFSLKPYRLAKTGSTVLEFDSKGYSKKELVDEWDKKTKITEQYWNDKNLPDTEWKFPIEEIQFPQ